MHRWPAFSELPQGACQGRRRREWRRQQHKRGDDGGNCGAVNVATGDRIEVDGNKTEHPYRTRKTAPGKRSRTVGSR
ncbi:hypothetical protein ASD99_25140 [Mesorhizobium sp. Root695]|nr:hypothetical protein ASD99_25140 [Mesorhizobium sp. Root695]